MLDSESLKIKMEKMENAGINSTPVVPKLKAVIKPESESKAQKVKAFKSHPTFASTSACFESCLPVVSANGPDLKPLRKKLIQARLVIEAPSKKQNKVLTGVSCSVENSKFKSWTIRLPKYLKQELEARGSHRHIREIGIWCSVIRELSQNKSDACVRTAAVVECPPKMIWACEETPQGAILRLNGKIAAELMVYIIETKKDGFEVRLVTYNRGCVLAPHAFQPGSKKGNNSEEVQTYIAGTHGIGLKDVLGLILSTPRDRYGRPLAYSLMDSLTAITYFPQGIPYQHKQNGPAVVDEVDSDDNYGGESDCSDDESDDEGDRSQQYFGNSCSGDHFDRSACFRRYELRHNKVKQDLNTEHEAFVMDVIDTPQAASVPVNIKNLFKKMMSEDDPVAGTVFSFTKKGLNQEQALALQTNILTAARTHPFNIDASHFEKLQVSDDSLRERRDGVDLTHEVLIARTEHAKKAVQREFVINLYPGLHYCAVPLRDCHQLDNHLSVILSAAEVQTGRDRNGKWSDDLRESVGKVLFLAMDKEIGALPAQAIQAEHAAQNSLEQNRDLSAVNVLLLVLQRLKCPVAYEVVRFLLADIQADSSAPMSPITEALLYYAISKEENRGAISDNNPVAVLIGEQIFCCFETTSDQRDCDVLTALYELAKTRENDLELQQLRIPLRVRGHPELRQLFVSSKFVKEDNIKAFLIRECERTELWRPAEKANRRDNKRVQNTWDKAIRIEAEDEEEEDVTIKVYVLDVPQVLFGEEKFKYFEPEHIFAVIDDPECHLFEDDESMMLQLSNYNRKFTKRFLGSYLSGEFAGVEEEDSESEQEPESEPELEVAAADEMEYHQAVVDMDTDNDYDEEAYPLLSDSDDEHSEYCPTVVTGSSDVEGEELMRDGRKAGKRGRGEKKDRDPVKAKRAKQSATTVSRATVTQDSQQPDDEEVREEKGVEAIAPVVDAVATVADLPVSAGGSVAEGNPGAIEPTVALPIAVLQVPVPELLAAPAAANVAAIVDEIPAALPDEAQDFTDLGIKTQMARVTYNSAKVSLQGYIHLRAMRDLQQQV